MSQLECLLGLSCNDFAMIAADQTTVSSIIVMKSDKEKLYKISDTLVMGVVGDGGDTAQFTQYIAKNMQLYRMRNLYSLGIDGVVHFTRRNLADSLRSGSPYEVNMLFAGYEEKTGGQLYYMDFLASCFKVPFAAHGFGGLLCMSILQQYYKPTLKEDEAYHIMQLCVKEVHQRLFIKLPTFQVSSINKYGIQQLPVISMEGK